ncbi:hypothetical protein [Acetobacterium wieringae]|uniref:Uncharacterized protein n=1 Tax=Acetobacterium wieringae TaxID=52694 RepID=A0A1F2PDR0_9FIRM|nr:hypothetical protein [Acetobacterium wieringae]OFV69175.1 hypothetical protein ACWI_33690 [Acetobacterium wieringae]
MFSNCGGKIKNLAKIIFWFGLIVGVLWLIVSLAQYANGREYLEYSSAYGGSSSYSILQESGDRAYTGLVGIYYSIILLASSIVTSWPLYGFGIIVAHFENDSENSGLEADTNNQIEETISTEEITHAEEAKNEHL